MRCLKALLLCSILALCAAAPARPGRAPDKSQEFDRRMSLEETVAWLGRQLTHTRSVGGGKQVRRYETRLVKAKGCTLSYQSSYETDSYSLDSAAGAIKLRELWTVDLSGLDPSRIRVVPAVGVLDSAVRFNAAAGSRSAIRGMSFRNDALQTTYTNRRYGQFSVRDERLLPQAADALAHAVELCRQRKP